MTNEPTKQIDKNALATEVLIKGDLRNLTEPQRLSYYMKVCESVGLNPLTKPFEYIVLNGKMTLYALRGCTDQLRTVHGVSVTEMTETEREGVFIVTVKVSNKEGRTDMAKGAVNISGLKGDNLANALMKAETKAKRRATLSICGLGLLDETEIETIPGAVPVNITPSEVDPSKPKSQFSNATARNAFCKNIKESIAKAICTDDLDLINKMNDAQFTLMQNSGAEADTEGLRDIKQAYTIKWNNLTAGENDGIPAHVKEQDEQFNQQFINATR